MTTTAHEDQFTVGTQTIETVRQPYSTVAILRRNIADMEVALKQQTERAEAAEAELAKLREQKPVAYVKYKTTGGNVGLTWMAIPTGEFYPREGEKLYTDPVPVPYKGATHCDDCGLTWLDDGLNPLRCPYCKDTIPAPAVPNNWEDIVTDCLQDDDHHYNMDAVNFNRGVYAAIDQLRALLQSTQQAPAVPQNELVAAITVYLKADDEMHQATRRTGFGGMGKPVASEAEQRHLAAIRHAARGHLEALLQSAEVTNAAADRLMEGGE